MIKLFADTMQEQLETVFNSSEPPTPREQILCDALCSVANYIDCLEARISALDDPTRA